MQSDEALYYEVRGGSKEAYAKLYQKYERPLFGFILRRIPNRQDAEDIFQEAMLAVLRTPTMKFEGNGAFAGWLYKVALNAILNRARSRQREVAATTAYRGLSLVQGNDGETEVQLEQLATAAKDLSPTLGDVYHLRSSGKSYEEIATDLNIPVGTVKSRIHLMIAHLRKGFNK